MRMMLCAVAMALAVSPTSAFAQNAPSPAAQALADCVARATTEEDNVVLTRWMFVALARHPSLAGLTSIPDAERVNANRRMGQLFNRLLLENCRTETRAAWLADGEDAIAAPFRTFGERAAMSLMGHPDVNAAVTEMTSYFDQAGFVALTAAQ